MRITQVSAPLLLLFASQVAARDFYLTPQGSGLKNGSSWDNSLEAAQLSKSFNELLKPGDCLLLGGGTYTNVSLRVSSGGDSRAPKTLRGVDCGHGLPVLTGTWSETTPAGAHTPPPASPEVGARTSSSASPGIGARTFLSAPVAICLDPGVSHCAFENFGIRNFTFAVQAVGKENAPSSGLLFRNISVDRVRYGFFLRDCDDLQITDCTVKRYTKHGFRFEAGCDRVTLTRLTADCTGGDPSWEKLTEPFPFGFTVNDAGDPNSGFVFEDCAALHNLMPLQKTHYKNGDGFVVEGNTVGVRFLRCRSMDNQDGGFDLKPANVVLQDCVAVGNFRGFRIWRSAELRNCFAGFGTTGLWCNGGPVSAERCTFHQLSNAAIMTDDRAQAPVILSNCILSSVKRTSLKSASGEVRTVDCVLERYPEYLNPASTWSGLDDGMNSRAYPDKGYVWRAR